MPRRQHDDRHSGSLSDFAADVDASHVGQAEVEHDEIGTVVGRGVDARRSVGGFVDADGDVAQRVAHRTSNLGFVVDDENEIGVRHRADGGEEKACAKLDYDITLVRHKDDRIPHVHFLVVMVTGTMRRQDPDACGQLVGDL